MAEAIKSIIQNLELEEVKSPDQDTAIKPNPEKLSVFFESTTELARRDGVSMLLPFNQHMFLRLFPSKAIEPIPSTLKALELIRSGQLIAMSGRDLGTCYERNKYGAIAFNNDGNKILLLTQLFLNKELWGIDAFTIDKQRIMERANVGFGYFPCGKIEKIYIETLKNYLKFASTTLDLPLPLQFIAGATDVNGYRMAVPDEVYREEFNRFPGDEVIVENLEYKGIITSYSSKPSEILRPFFKYMWEESGLTRPDKEVLE